jgi:hypothetical protein
LEQEIARLKREKTGIRPRAEQSLFVDKNGEVRIKAWADRRGLSLFLTDKNGNIRAVLGVKNDGPWLSLVDENQKKRVELNTGNDGQGLILQIERQDRICVGASRMGPDCAYPAGW